jgi:hypothetical protein
LSNTITLPSHFISNSFVFTQSKLENSRINLPVE